MHKIQTWDVFCRVIDNYGDIGVSWRLAKQLANEYDFRVRLWVDDIAALKQIWPTTTYAEHQHLEKVEVCVWKEPFSDTVCPAEVVIEAFACNVPDSYLDAMTRRKQTGAAPFWFNLEYLSAERWVEDCHRLVSIHPSTGLKKTFFFPGFTPKTAGLLREQSLLVEQNIFWASPIARDNFLTQIGVALDTGILISLFAYENPALESLLQTWQNSPELVTCLVPHGKILTSVCAALNQEITVGQHLILGNLRLHILPFLNQRDYDYLLWCCDINFVRGEDSFARAQWAGKPFIWHIYPQEDNAHMIKLHAFLQLYCHELDPHMAQALTDLWQGWNQGNAVENAWVKCLEARQYWQNHSVRWVNHLNSLGDLTANLVHFCQKTL